VLKSIDMLHYIMLEFKRI